MYVVEFVVSLLTSYLLLLDSSHKEVMVFQKFDIFELQLHFKL